MKGWFSAWPYYNVELPRQSARGELRFSSLPCRFVHLGRIDHFTIHFQPSGFNRLFGLPMTELTDAAHDAHAVIGPRIAMLERELGDLQSFAERIQLVEKRLIQIVSRLNAPDPVAIAANSLFASNGMQRVSTMAAASGLSIRQFERRFLAGRAPSMGSPLISTSGAELSSAASIEIGRMQTELPAAHPSDSRSIQPHSVVD